MTVEATTKAAGDTARATVRGLEGLLKRAWSLMDAASEKKTPSDYLSSRAIQSIQGKYPQ